MKVIVTIAVRNPEWYGWKDDTKNMQAYREEWQYLNEGKVEKHLPIVKVPIPFEVLSCNKKVDFEFKDSSESGKVHRIKDVTVVEFVGEKNQVHAVVSNSLIHQYLAINKEEGTQYIYFYIKEDAIYEKVNSLIWLSEEHIKELDETFEY